MQEAPRSPESRPGRTSRGWSFINSTLIAIFPGLVAWGCHAGAMHCAPTLALWAALTTVSLLVVLRYAHSARWAAGSAGFAIFLALVMAGQSIVSFAFIYQGLSLRASSETIYYEIHGVDAPDASATRDREFSPPFHTALYFSAATWTTLGYGDVAPAMGEARWVAAIEGILGTAFVGIVAGVVLYALQRSLMPRPPAEKGP